MRPRYLKFICAVLLLAFCLAGCAQEQDPPESGPSVPASTGSSPVSEFEEALQAQESLTLEAFMANYEKARELAASGITPNTPMPVFTADALRQNTSSVSATNGLYAVNLDPEIFGTATFYVIPAGLRPMTADEYLALAQHANISADVLVQKQNSWIAVQANLGTASRTFTAKERFWMYFQLYDKLFDREQPPAQPDAPIALPVGCGSDVEEYTLYPTADMSAYALQIAVEMMCSRMPAEQQALLLPSENELGWEAAVDTALLAMSTHTDRSGTLERNYVRYTGRLSGTDGQRVGTWTVALYYSDGASYQINLDSATGEVNTISQMSDGYLAYETQWDENQPASDEAILYSK